MVNKLKTLLLNITYIQDARKCLISGKVSEKTITAIDAVLDNKADEFKAELAAQAHKAAQSISVACADYLEGKLAIHELYGDMGKHAAQIANFRAYMDALNAVLRQDNNWRENLPVDNS